MSKKSKQKSPSQPSISSVTSWDVESTTSRVDDNDDDDDAAPENTDTGLKDSLERIDERTDVEKELYILISKGDHEAAEKLISENRQDIDINHKNLLGHDLLTHAVENRKKKMISLVLNIDPDNVNTQEALLHAIKEDRLAIVLMLLYFEDHKHGGALYAVSKRMIYTNKSKTRSKKKHGNVVGRRKGGDDGPDEESTIALPESFDDSEYGWGMTPLMQAAIHGRYEILEVLYNRGERLPDFHYQSCKCVLCLSATRDLERTQRRINLLKAQCNPTFMIFMAGQDGSYDPVYEGLELTARCEFCKGEEPEFSDEYNEISESVSQLPVDLLSMCRTCDEVKIFLNQTEGYVGPSSMPYPRLATAMNYGNKLLVSHPQIQFFLQTEFRGPIWKTPRSQFERIAKFVVTALMMLLFPVVQLFLWCSLFCCSDLPAVRYLLSPNNRSLSKLASYIAYCTLLLFMNKEQRYEQGDCVPPTIYVRYMAVIYTLALFVELIRRFMLNPAAFPTTNWNYLDLWTQIFMWFSFCFWGFIEYKFYVNGVDCRPRRSLHWMDVQLVEECIFAIATTLATLRLLRWYILSRRIGPFQAGINRMAKHLPMVLFFMTWTVFSFSYSSKILYHPYLNSTKYDEKDERWKAQPKGFSDSGKLFLDYHVGDLGPDDVEIYSSSRSMPIAGSSTRTEEVKNEHKLTQIIASLMLLLWNIIGIKFLKESVTGLFGSTGVQVLQAKDIEWNYDRAKEMLHCIQDGHLAPPFNLIPNGACMASAFGWIYATTCGKGSGETEAGCNFGECCYMRDVENPEEREDKMKEYPFLLRKLFMRYFKFKRNDDDTANKENVSEVQEKVKELRELCKLVVGYESPVRGQSKASDLGRKESKRIQPETKPSESTSQQGSLKNNDSPKSSTPKKAMSGQKAEDKDSMQVVVSPKSKSKNGKTP